jgi:hypothetical protein
MLRANEQHKEVFSSVASHIVAAQVENRTNR